MSRDVDSRTRSGSIIAISVAIAIAASTAGASAQAPSIPAEGELPTEALLVQRRAHHAAALYGVGISFAGTAALLGAYTGLRVYQGDTTTVDGFFALIAAPILGSAGLSILASAAGLDAGVSLWNAARRARTGNERLTATGLFLEQRPIRHAIVALYVSGVTTIVAGGAVVGAFWGDTSALVGGASAAVVGYLLVLAAAGMDVAAGAWSGAVLAPTLGIAPTVGGAVASMAGAF